MYVIVKIKKIKLKCIYVFLCIFCLMFKLKKSFKIKWKINEFILRINFLFIIIVILYCRDDVIKILFLNIVF